mmetsp:Transcript_4064/g.18489  ORF Transcript_4064/g.18489 Transcript_4064/m.18489 type:complete len:151 (+) Transcript_4064:97-549(+)
MDTEARRRSCRAWTEKPLFKEAKTTTDKCTERELGGISSDDDIGENANSEDTNMNESRADLSKLEPPSLRKYRRLYKLGEVQNGGTKEELMPAVVRHWNQTIVDEDETLIAFALSLRKQALSGSSSSLGVNRTNATKTLVRAGFKQRARQ